MARRQPYLNWTASRDGIRHAFHGRRRITLCGLTVNEQHSQPDQPRCSVCLVVEQEEAAITRR